MAADAQCHSGETMKRDLASIKGSNLSSALAPFAMREHRLSVSRSSVFQENAEIQVFM